MPFALICKMQNHVLKEIFLNHVKSRHILGDYFQHCILHVPNHFIKNYVV